MAKKKKSGPQIIISLKEYELLRECEDKGAMSFDTYRHIQKLLGVHEGSGIVLAIQAAVDDAGKWRAASSVNANALHPDPYKASVIAGQMQKDAELGALVRKMLPDSQLRVDDLGYWSASHRHRSTADHSSPEEAIADILRYMRPECPPLRDVTEGDTRRL
jgi:hypothetical protein